MIPLKFMKTFKQNGIQMIIIQNVNRLQTNETNNKLMKNIQIKGKAHYIARIISFSAAIALRSMLRTPIACLSP